MDQAPRVYVSYSSPDREQVEQLYRRLQAAGLQPWTVERDVSPGENWRAKMQTAIRASNFFVPVLSRHSVSLSESRQEELQIARDVLRSLPPESVYIIPVRLEDAEVPVEFRELLWIDLFADGGFERLVDTIKTAFARGPAADDYSEVSQAQSNAAPLLKSAGEKVVQQTTARTTNPPIQPTDQSTPPAAERLEVASRALADAPSAVDLLGFSDYADALADFIKSEKTEKPLTIGIDAPWGMGKTTLMQMIRQRLVVRDEQGKPIRAFPTVWFNAWRFDEEKSLWAALALAILTETRKQLNWAQRARLWFVSRSLGLRHLDTFGILQNLVKVAAYVIIILGVGYAAIAVLSLDMSLPQSVQDLQTRGGIIGTLAFLASVYLAGRELMERVLKSFNIRVEQLSDSSKAVTAERVSFLSQFDEEFKVMAAILTEGGKWPIVVFIDDLERCTPPRPAEIMEAINLFLGSQYTVFVIGMDAQMVAGSIQSKYKDLKAYLDEVEESGGVTLGQRFVEKIVQLNFQIPRSDPEKFASFISANLSAGKAPPARPAEEQVAQAEQLIRAEQRAGASDLDAAVRSVQARRASLPAAAIAQARQEIFAKSFDDSDEVRRAVRLATPYMGFNPRKLKRFINNFRLQALVTNRRGLLNDRSVELPLLAKWMIVVTRWPDLVDALEADPSALQKLREVDRLRAKLEEVQRDPRLELLVRSDDQAIAANVTQRLNLTENNANADSEAEVKLQLAVLNARLAHLLAESRLNRLANSADLMHLLKDLSDEELATLPRYLHLARMSDMRASREA